MQDVAQWGHHVARFERSRRGLGQKRRVEHEVDVVDEDQARRLLRQQPLELAGGRRSPEAPTGDDDVPGHGSANTQLVTTCYKTQSRPSCADQARDLAPVRAALGLAHDETHEGPDRLLVAGAHTLGGLGIRLDRPVDDRLELVASPRCRPAPRARRSRPGRRPRRPSRPAPCAPRRSRSREPRPCRRARPAPPARLVNRLDPLLPRLA